MKTGQQVNLEVLVKRAEAIFEEAGVACAIVASVHGAHAYGMQFGNPSLVSHADDGNLIKIYVDDNSTLADFENDNQRMFGLSEGLGVLHKSAEFIKEALRGTIQQEPRLMAEGKALFETRGQNN